MVRRLMPIAAASAALAGAAGLVAQEAVEVDGRAHDELATHRSLNIGFVALTVGLAVARARRERPGPAYLLAGLAGLATMTYSTYLGGKMVYEHGVGVRPAGGLREGAAPEIRPGDLRRAARGSAHQAVHGARHAAEHVAEGEVVPTLTR